VQPTYGGTPLGTSGTRFGGGKESLWAHEKKFVCGASFNIAVLHPYTRAPPFSRIIQWGDRDNVKKKSRLRTGWIKTSQMIV